jgi:hypothetical protein
MPYSLEMWLKLLGKENDEMRRRYGLMPYALCLMLYALFLRGAAQVRPYALCLMLYALCLREVAQVRRQRALLI